MILFYCFPTLLILAIFALQSAEIKANVIKYFKEIADVLAYVNRQMILIFKTNDLLRGIESSLGTKNSMSTFIQVD